MKVKTTVSIHKDELRKERYAVLVQGLNIALADIESDIRVADVSNDDVNLSMEFSRKKKSVIKT